MCPCSTEDAKALTAATLRQRMEQHRAKPSCAVVPQQAGSAGFRPRELRRHRRLARPGQGVPIDSSGTLPSGESFRGPRELKAVLKAHTPDFARCLTEKMLTYALGRGLEEYDHCAVEQIVKSLAIESIPVFAAGTGDRQERPVPETARLTPERKCEA